ncbi:hypothetical protein [Bradyrhizobium cosmicum]|uniref:hypothetical protein n=1 Tax=Bradyrhizobium cosmicum TaxID=1404864 RepID=UPI0005A1783E|nr:hypothetical protein [Bradyrhizobium cosmicum]
MMQSDVKERRLSRSRAVWDAFWGTEIGYFPRFKDDHGREQSNPDDIIITSIATQLAGIVGPDDPNKLDSLIEHGRESLDEVKELTEYEDQKATRLLTIVTFLTALAGVLFTRYVDLYPLRAVFAQYGGYSFRAVLVVAGYIVFLLFVLSAVCGALIVFHATRIRFKYPSLLIGTRAGEGKPTRSFLFFREIVQVTPKDWADSFLEDSTGGKKIREDLRLSFFKNYVTESYLVAAKVGDKLRYLSPAQNLLWNSIRIFLVWLIVATTVVTFVPEKTKSDQRQSNVLEAPKPTSSPAVVPKSSKPAGKS